MCRNIRTLHNFEPPTSREELQSAALQYVRKVSGMQKPSRANEAAFGLQQPKANEITIGKFTYSGIFIQALKTDNPLQLVNPFAPPNLMKASPSEWRKTWRFERTSDCSVERTWSSWTETDVWLSGKTWPSDAFGDSGVPG